MGLKDLPAITLGRIENVKVGDIVLAIGNPFGVGQTVTMGIVSALGRSHLGINTFENFIQTDAAINRAIRAAHWSMRAATCSASIRRSIRARAARWGSASPSRYRLPSR